MSSVVAQVAEWLPVYGPWLLFTLAVLETCFVTGLVVPSGLATSLGTILALEGQLSLAPVLVAALAGGAVGDSLGFWIGRVAGERLLGGDGALARRIDRRHEALSRFFGRHPLYSVTTARLVSFVRTLMPMAAGMSGIGYARYLPYELVGLVGWLVIYVTIGAVAGESWEAVTRVVGVGGAVLFALAGVGIWVAVRKARAGGAPEGAS